MIQGGGRVHCDALRIDLHGRLHRFTAGFHRTLQITQVHPGKAAHGEMRYFDTTESMLTRELCTTVEVIVSRFHVAANIGRVPQSSECPCFAFERIRLAGIVEGRLVRCLAVIDSTERKAQVAAQMV